MATQFLPRATLSLVRDVNVPLGMRRVTLQDFSSIRLATRPWNTSAVPHRGREHLRSCIEGPEQPVAWNRVVIGRSKNAGDEHSGTAVTLSEFRTHRLQLSPGVAYALTLGVLVIAVGPKLER